MVKFQGGSFHYYKVKYLSHKRKEDFYIIIYTEKLLYKAKTLPLLYTVYNKKFNSHTILKEILKFNS